MKSEAEMVDILKIFFENQDLIVTTEVPMLSKRIDMLCLNLKTNDIIAVEAKLQKWKRALQQALTYRVCSEHVYIAIHHDFSHRVDRELLQKKGVGLIVVNQNEVTIPIEPSESMITHHRIKEDVMSFMGGEHSVNF